MSTLIRDDEVTIRHGGKRTVELHSSAKVKRSWPDSPATAERVDEYTIEWNESIQPPGGPEIPAHALADETVHYRVIGCPDCKINSRAVFRGFPDDPHYECLVCGYTNGFDPAGLSGMRRSEAEVVE